MPFKSQAQRIAAIIAEKVKKGEAKTKPGSPSAKMSKSLTTQQLNDFTQLKPAQTGRKPSSRKTGRH